MSRTKAFTAQRWLYEAEGGKFVLAKGNSKYSRFYVLDEDGKYLSRKGHNTLLDAQIEAAKAQTALHNLIAGLTDEARENLSILLDEKE